MFDFEKFAGDFYNFMQNYEQKKQNEIDFGRFKYANRIRREIFNLDEVISNPIKLSGPFTGAQVERIYDSTTGVSVSGSIKLIFDQPTRDKVLNNHKVMVENDSFDTEGVMVSEGWVIWDQAAANTVCEIVFFNDIAYRSGSQKTTITGSVSAVISGTVETNANITNTCIGTTPCEPTKVDISSGSGSFTVAGPSRVTIHLNGNNDSVSFNGVQAFKCGVIGSRLVKGAGNLYSAPLNGNAPTTNGTNYQAGGLDIGYQTGSGAQWVNTGASISAGQALDAVFDNVDVLGTVDVQVIVKAGTTVSFVLSAYSSVYIEEYA